MKFSEILNHIGGYATEQHDGTILTNCPAHADSHPSLVIWPSTAHTTLTCRAGCGYNDILKAAGLRADDLKGVDLDGYAPVSSDTNAPANNAARNRIAAKAYLWAINLASDNGHPAKLAREKYGADTTDADALFELGLRAVRIETKLDLHFQNIESWKAEVEQTNADYEGRLRSLERWKYSIPATLITAAVSLYLSAWK